MAAELRLQVGHENNTVRDAAFSGDGKFVVTAGTDGSFLWKVASGLLLLRLPPAGKCSISPGTKDVLSPGSRHTPAPDAPGGGRSGPAGKVALWNVRDKKPSDEKPIWSHDYGQVPWSNFGFLKKIAFWSWSAPCRGRAQSRSNCEVWRMAENAQPTRESSGNLPAITSVFFESKSRTLWLGTRDGAILKSQPTLEGKWEVVKVREESGHSITALAVRPSSGECLWIENGRLYRKLPGPRDPPIEEMEVKGDWAKFSQDADCLITGDGLGNVRVWATDSSKAIRLVPLPAPRSDRLASATVDPGGRRFPDFWPGIQEVLLCQFGRRDDHLGRRSPREVGV